MEQTGIIVDGPGDYHSLRTRFRSNCKILKTDGPRGVTVSIDDMVSHASKQISMLMACSCGRIVVLLDFEMRADDYTEFMVRIAEKFAQTYSEYPVSVAIPNRMIENWYLADIAYLSQCKAFIKNNLRQKIYEGLHGKEELKKCFISKFSYSETKHGPQLFEILRFDVARQNSHSFDDFLSKMNITNGN